MAKKTTAKPEVIAPVRTFKPETIPPAPAPDQRPGKPEIISPAPAPVQRPGKPEIIPPAKVTPTAEQDAAELDALKKQIAEIAKQTGQKVNKSTGEVILDEGAVANKFSTKSTSKSTEELIKQYTSDVLNKMSQEEKTAERLSAYNILKMEFDQYGLSSLVTDIKDLLVNDTPTSEFGLRLRGTDAYKARFKANEARIAAGLSALSPSEYVALEDQYQNVMRNYGLPASYYTKDSTGKQAGFEKFIAGDVSAVELEDRISTAQKRVINSNPEVTTALKQFYPDITNGDILAYTLDPTKGLEDIKRKVTAAEIGGAALQSGLETNLARAVQLGKYGVDKAAATQGYSTIGAGLQRGSQLAAIYKETPYVQATAEEEIFNMTGATKAREKRQKITGLEKAAFSGQTGLTSGALARDRAGGY
jgi:hypothetical protein